MEDNKIFGKNIYPCIHMEDHAHYKHPKTPKPLDDCIWIELSIIKMASNQAICDPNIETCTLADFNNSIELDYATPN